MVRPRPKRGERRIDAAIDHLADYGFPKTQIRKTINSLLQLYGRDGWVFLEEGSYRVVLEKLLEEQTEQQQDQQQEAAVADEASPENDHVSRVHSKAPTRSQSSPQPQAPPNNSPSLEPVRPLPPARKAAAIRPPCRGWISEESDTESEPEDGEIISHIPRPVDNLPYKRKRASRWDVRPN